MSTDPMDALKPERGLKVTPETMKAAQLVLNRLYEADHQVLFELTKMMATQMAIIVRRMQGGDMELEEAFIDGMQTVMVMLPGAEEEAAEGYRPVPVDVWTPHGGGEP